jgi:hypothetical protein
MLHASASRFFFTLLHASFGGCPDGVVSV